MASTFFHKLLNSLSSGSYSSLPLPGRMARCKVRQVANLLLSLVHHSSDCTGCHSQGVLHRMGSGRSRATMLGWGCSWGGGLASRHKGRHW